MSNIKKKGFNLFDDDVEATNIKQILKRGSDGDFDDYEDDDTADVINWDGSSASGGKVGKSMGKHKFY